MSSPHRCCNAPSSTGSTWTRSSDSGSRRRSTPGRSTGRTGMPRAVQFDRYGDRDVLYVADVPAPEPAAGEVVVEVRAAGINPGEATIRSGALDAAFPATFPSGEGSDLAGVVSS